MGEPRTAVITGASAGIGAATAAALASQGFDLYLGARRRDRLQRVANRLGGHALELDVTRQDSVDRFAAACPDRVDLLVNNAGGARGLERLEDSNDQTWREMWELNVLGVVRTTRAFLPALRRSGNAHVIVVGSISGFETYPGGGGYTSTKHALRAVTRTLRRELIGEPIRVTEIAPGMVETEFSIQRFDGDQERAAAVYEGLKPLEAEDVAECIAFAASRPPHVNIDELVVKPLAQVDSLTVHREDE